MVRLMGLVAVVVLAATLVGWVWGRMVQAAQRDTDHDAAQNDYDGVWRIVDEPGPGALTVLLVRENDAGVITGRHIVGELPGDTPDWCDAYLRLRAEAEQRRAALEAGNTP